MQSDDPSLFLATAPADRREVHFALAAVLASTALFISARLTQQSYMESHQATTTTPFEISSA